MTSFGGFIRYHDAGTNTFELTAEVANVVVTPGATDLLNTANATCKGVVNLKRVEEATYTTGNTIITGETEAGEMVSVWYE